jgi:acid phosphatase family membrane protein YuiD
MAQPLKLVFELTKNRSLSSVLVTTGECLVLISAFVAALATECEQTLGWDSPEFAIALILRLLLCTMPLVYAKLQAASAYSLNQNY